LLTSPTFPRSVRFCVGAAERCLDELAESEAARRPQRLAGKLRAELEFADPIEFTEALTVRLTHLEDEVRHIADAMGPAFFRSADEFHLHAQWLMPSEATW